MNDMRLQTAMIDQGTYKKVLCLCTANSLRSPTAAIVLAQEPFNFNTRSAGTVPFYALIPVDDVLVAWADEIVCMEAKHAEGLPQGKKVVVLDIPNDFKYRQPELMGLIKTRYMERA